LLKFEVLARNEARINQIKQLTPWI